jgi:hypothetical protein
MPVYGYGAKFDATTFARKKARKGLKCKSSVVKVLQGVG